MKPLIGFRDWGVVDYAEALEMQRRLFNELIARKNAATAEGRNSGGASGILEGPSNGGSPGTSEGRDAGWLIFCEHPHVYTLGRSGRAENLLVSEEFLRSKGAALHRIERGGDITYHGPGQIVAYPIVDLDIVGLGLREYVEVLEEAVIETVAAYGIEAGRVAGKTGVWVGGATEECSEQIPRRADALARDDGRRAADSKICAIGVKASRGVVMHGLALNVATDLDWFRLINPCGFAPGAVTSIENETGRKVDMAGVKRVLRDKLLEKLKKTYKN
jgi:lipoyl(octanoyl) transferase